MGYYAIDGGMGVAVGGVEIYVHRMTNDDKPLANIPIKVDLKLRLYPEGLPDNSSGYLCGRLCRPSVGLLWTIGNRDNGCRRRPARAAHDQGA